MEGAVDHPQRYRGGPQHPLIHKQQRMSPWYGTGIPMLTQRRQYHEWDNLKDGTIPKWDNLMGQSPHNGTTPTMTLINHHDISSNGTTCSSTNHVNRHGNYAHYSQTRVRSFFKIKWSGKTKKWHIFAPPLKEGGLSQSSTMKKSSKKCPSSNPTSEHGFSRKYYPHFHRSRPGKTLTDGKNIFSKNHVQIQQGNKHKK